MIQKIGSFLGWLTGSDQSWYLVLDESAIIRDRELKKESLVMNISRRDFNARSYEKEIMMRSGGVSLNEIWGVMNPFAMIRFLGYSLSDIV
ncbi:MAG: hypothetical protein CMN93_05255 [Synechococcus sp. CPC35]|nr:hypothetical protein [Synechococcus sp. CPC35]